MSNPVICAECEDTGKIVRLNDGNHLTCSLMNNRPIWGSKPRWCPKSQKQEVEHEDDYDYERASDMRDYCERYEPTYNPEDGSM